MTGQPDVAGAVLALDRAMIALAVAKSTLLGERRIRPCPECARDIADEAHQIGCPLDLAAAEASPANPYGSTQPLAEPELATFLDEQCTVDWGSATPSQRCIWVTGHNGDHRDMHGHTWPQAPTGHLPQHTHGEPGCTYTGCTLHDAAVTR